MSIHEYDGYDWFGIGYSKITFSDDLNFDPTELEIVYKKMIRAVLLLTSKSSPNIVTPGVV